jgi:protein-S-isoprenylcysteine O-methyltransferase Ste14
VDIREVVFNNRSYTPIPIIIVTLILAQPNWISFVLGILIALTGEAVRLWAVSHAGSATRTTSGAGGDELIMTGPFAHTRNPLYLGNFLLTIGLCIAAWPWMPWMLIIVIGLFIFQYSLIISLEEEYLRNKFSQLYQEYLQNVPRFIPRFKPYNSQQNRIPCFTKALRSERSTLTSLTVVSLLILLRWQVWS